MDKVALLPARDRAALFGETAARRGVANTIIEKDFWVCWTLKQLFGLQRDDAPTLVLKGGTSLSKAFDAIRRFSEDIDLSFDRADLGYSGDRDPEKEGISKKQSARLIEQLMHDVEGHIADRLLPALRTAIAGQLGQQTDGEWSLEIDAQDPQSLNFRYPPAFPRADYQRMTYISPRVKLELGARGDPWPTERKSIRPYAAEDFPDFFEAPECSVTVLSARRTFWEKVTALHAEAHRPDDSSTPQYFSRHYYDTAMLLDTEDGRAAVGDFQLLEQVANHKRIFFRSSWASYETARPGTLTIIPADIRIRDLRADYRDMAPMMFDEKPLSFDAILTCLRELQDTINGSNAG
jgi:hypothetical protein